jgi:hypothetical protein
VGRAFVLLLDREPTPAERQVCLQALDVWRGMAGAADLPAQDAARSHVVWALLNHNEFVTLR